MARKRILFIDSDDAFVREMAAQAQHKGFEALTTTSSTEGVDLAHQQRPDLIVVNVELSPTNGWSVCTKLKKDDDLRGIPVVLTSSTSTLDTFEKHKKLKTRADEYLLKPYSPEDFIRIAGGLVGVPEEHVADEDMVIEDESLAMGEFDGQALDESIPVAGDEAPPDVDPLAPASEAALGGDALSDLPSDEISEEGVLAEDGVLADGEEGVAQPPPPPDDSVDELAAFDESFDHIAGTAVAAAAPLEDVGAVSEESYPAFDEQPAEEAVAEEAVAEEAVAEEAVAEEAVAEEAVAEEAVAEVAVADELSPGTDGAFADEATSFASSLESEVPVSEAVAAPDADVAPLEEVSSYAGHNEDDAARAAELEARVAELEAEIEGYRATESSHDSEIERLRADGARKDKESQELRDQLHERDRQLREMKEGESRATIEATKARDERVRRDAAMKALAQKAEQMSAQAKRLERDVFAAREELKALPALKAKIAEDEQARKDADAAAAAEIASLKEKVAGAEKSHDDLKTAHAQLGVEHETAKSDLEGTRGDLESTRKTVEETKATIAALEEKLAALDEKFKTLQLQSQAADGRIARAKTTLTKAIEDLG